ncbi:hypothetical protein MW887_005044 [Aspergillus wentii]|nr:hypothetical protein MW887_005044 [Aspergillus wentii]
MGWLRYFLAPMQDGEFLDQGINRPLGPAIFAFVGGTCENFRQFYDSLKCGYAKASKIPDFMSRLRGYVNIRGPNEYNPRTRAERHRSSAETPSTEASDDRGSQAEDLDVEFSDILGFSNNAVPSVDPMWQIQRGIL